MDNEAAQTGTASSADANAETSGQAAGGSAPSPSSGPALAAGGHSSAKRQEVLAAMPTLHESDVDVNVDACQTIVLAAMPDDREQWTQQGIDWDKKYCGAKSGNLLDTREVWEGQLRELGEKLEVAEPTPVQEARAQNLEIVYGKWLDDAKGTPEGPAAVRSRLVATQVNTYAREDVTQATPPIKASRIILSQAATKTNAKGQHDCLIGRRNLSCETQRASRDCSPKGIGAARYWLEMRESVVRGTGG